MSEASADTKGSPPLSVGDTARWYDVTADEFMTGEIRAIDGHAALVRLRGLGGEGLGRYRVAYVPHLEVL